MLYRTSFRGLLASAVTLASLMGVAGCGGLSAGDYVFYRVAFDREAPSAKCYQGGVIPASIKEDTTSFRSGRTFIVYVASDDEALLDIGEAVLPGTIDGDTYSFSAKDKDVEPLNATTIFDSDHDGIADNIDMMIDADGDGEEDSNGIDPSVDVDDDGLDDRFEDNLVDKNGDQIDDRIVEVAADTKTTASQTVTIDMTIDGTTATGTQKIVDKTSCTGPSCDPDYGTSCTRSSDFKGVEVEDADVDVAN